MIEVNLSPTKKGEEGQLQAILSKVNVKMMIIALVILFVPEFGYLTVVNTEISDLKEKASQLEADIQQLNKKLAELKKIEDQIQALKKLEIKLAEKLNVVKQIISRKQNPFHLMQYLANNTPKDLWITDLELKDKNLKLQGFSDSWKSIGVLLENLKSSIFFEKSIQYEQPKTRDSKYADWERKENFLISAKVVRFE